MNKLLCCFVVAALSDGDGFEVVSYAKKGTASVILSGIALQAATIHGSGCWLIFDPGDHCVKFSTFKISFLK